MKANAVAMPECETTLLKRLEFVGRILEEEIASHIVASRMSKSSGLESKSESKAKSPITVVESDSSPSI